MADLLSILSQSAASLNAHSGSAATATHNLENVNTPGYSRQSANLSALLPTEMIGGVYIGRGVTLSTVSQARDRFLEAQIPGALASAASAEAEMQALSAVTVLDPDLKNGLNANFSAYFSALNALSSSPNDPTMRANVVNAAKGLAASFQSTARGLIDARNALDPRVEGTVVKVNELAAQLASYNKAIRAARASGAEPNDLLDARLQVQDQLVELTGASPVANGKGDVSVVLPNGLALVVEDKAAKLSVYADANNDGHLSIQAAPPDGGTAVPIANFGGSLGGIFAARDVALKQAQDALDTLAFDFASSTNTIHSTGFAPDGTTGRNLFSVTGTAAGAAIALRVDPEIAGNPGLLANSTTNGGLSGDNSNLLALMNISEQALSTGDDPQATLARITTTFGAAAKHAKAMKEQEATVRDHLLQLRESASGVSIDEEMVKMTQAQRAYEAVTKVITAAGDMLDSLMKLR